MRALYHYSLSDNIKQSMEQRNNAKVAMDPHNMLNYIYYRK